ncbi:MAG: hypothetical protein Q7S48_01795 [bacterium]|nr:hypothetical protein [bacterium]
MNQLHRIAPIAASAIIFFLFELVFKRPRAIDICGLIIPLIFFITIYYILGKNLKTPLARFKFLITPTLFAWSALAFSLLVESAAARHILAFLVFIFLVLFFESIITYVWRHETYVGYSLENLSAYALTLTVFLASASLIGFYILLDLNLGLIALFALLVFFPVNFELFWIGKLPVVPSLRCAGVLTLIFLELFLVLALLPFHFIVAGAIITVLWYTAISLSRAHLLGIFSRKMLIRHLILCGVLLLLLIISAQ